MHRDGSCERVRARSTAGMLLESSERMADDLGRFSVQHWLENAAQGYLLGREHGHLAGEREPTWLLANEPLRKRAIFVTAQLVSAERCSLATSAGLVGLAPDDGLRRFLATQVIDEARHVEIFSQRLIDLGVPAPGLDAVVADVTSPNLARFAEALHAIVEERDFVPALVGHNVLLEGVMLSVCGLLHGAQLEQNPKFANTLAGTVLDERRHAACGETAVTARLRGAPELRARAERLQRDLTHWILAAFSDIAREAPLGPVAGAGPRGSVGTGRAEIEAFLSQGVEEDLSMRLTRIGLSYRAPVRS